MWRTHPDLAVEHCGKIEYEGGSRLNGSLWILIYTCPPKFVVTHGAVKCIDGVN